MRNPKLSKHGKLAMLLLPLLLLASCTAPEQIPVISGGGETASFYDLEIELKEEWSYLEGDILSTEENQFELSFEEAAYYSGILEDTLLWMKTQDEYGLTFLTSLNNIPAAVYGCTAVEKETPLCQGAVFFSQSGRYQLTAEESCTFDTLFESFTLNMEE